jgi:hypothetical protein
MATYRLLIVVVMLSQSVVSCNGNHVNSTQALKPYQSVITDTTSSTILTITKVKKPWYAWRSLIIGKMEESIPEYKAIKGINQKLYSFTENHKQFGGIYLWKTEKDANIWFNQAWYDRTEKKYGKKGIVDFYTVLDIRSFAEFPSQNGDYWCVMTPSENQINFSTAKGIIKSIKLKKDSGTTFYLTIWVDKLSAMKFFKNKNFVNEFFDTPIMIQNQQ